MRTSLLALLSAIALVACSQASRDGDAPAATAAEAVASAQPARDMAPYQALQAADLLKDRVFGPKLGSITAPAQQTCLRRTLEELPPLSLDSQRNAMSAAYGSHAENWAEGYVQASPDGHVDVLLNCEDDAAATRYLLLTSRGTMAPLAPGVANWLNQGAGGTGQIVVFDGHVRQEFAVAELLGGRRSPPAVERQPMVTEAAIETDSFSSVGGVLKVTSSEPDGTGTQELTLNGAAVPGFSNDQVQLIKAYRYGDRDLVLVTLACAGSACRYTDFGLIDVPSHGQATLIHDESMSINSDGAVPDIAVQADGSLRIGFTGFNGKQRLRYEKGVLMKD